MKNCYIFGTNTVARLLYCWLSLENKKPQGFVINEKYLDEGRYDLSAEITSIESVIGQYGADNIEVYLSVGYTKMNSIREKIFLWLKETSPC